MLRIALTILSLSACASRTTPARDAARAEREAQRAEPEKQGMTAGRMKRDMERRQRAEDEQRARDDYIGRQQR